MRYYALRFKTAPSQIRIARSSSPTNAFKLAFNMLPRVHGVAINAEWKDLGPTAIISDSKRTTVLHDPLNWEDFK